MKTNTMLFATDPKKLAEQGEIIDDLDVKLIEEMHALDNILTRLGEMGLTAYFAIRRDFPDDTIRLSQALTVTCDTDDGEHFGKGDHDKLIWVTLVRYASENDDEPMVKIAVTSSITRQWKRDACNNCDARESCTNESK